MADVALLAPKILKWEGGFVNDKADPGGATNMGVTLSTWRQVGYDKDLDGDIDADDIRLLNKEDFQKVLKKNYWDKWRADEIKSQSIADTLVDWEWGSGKYGIIIPQRILGVTPDGVVGPKTIEAINKEVPYELFNKIYAARVEFLNHIIEKSVSDYNAKMLKEHGRMATQTELLTDTFARYKQGWFNRLNDFKFKT